VKRTAIYTRLSRDRGGLSTSIDDQLQACADKAGPGYEHYSDRDVPASESQATRRRKRKEYARLLDDVAAGKVGRIVVWATDRLYRHPSDLEELIVLVERFRVEIVALQSGLVDLSTSTGRLNARMGAAIAKNEVENISARVSRKHASLAAAGNHAGGHRPFGFAAVDTVDVRGNVRVQLTDELVDAEADAIRDGAARILRGESAASVARAWNAAGFRTGRGKPFTHRAVRFILEAPRTAGIRRHQQKDGTVADVPATWPAIISKRDQARLAAVFAGNVPRLHGLTRHLLTGLVRCGECDSGMRAHYQRGARTYACLAGKGHAIRIMAEPLEDYVIRSAAPERVARPAVPGVLDPSRIDRELRDRIAAVQARLDELAELFAAGVVDASQLAAGSRPLRKEIDDLERQVASQAVPARGETWADVYGAVPAEGTPEYVDMVRAYLEEVVAGIVVAPVGRDRSKHRGVADRVAIRFRPGVKPVPVPSRPRRRAG